MELFNLAEFFKFGENKNLPITFVILIFFLFSLLLLKIQQKKEKFIKKIDNNLNYQDTYCKPFFKKV